MEVFEIHITGDESIIASAAKLSLKTISVDLLKPDCSVLRSEHMTSHVAKLDNYAACKVWVDGVVVDSLKKDGVEIIRVKIECPYYEHYKDQSLYIESHFDVDRSSHPMSRNQRKTQIMATDREYRKSEYDIFRALWDGEIVELCLYDTFVEEDKDWFDLYKLKARFGK